MDNLAAVNPSEQILTMENLRNANALLALLHGKSDSVCRLFDKEIIVDINQLDNLNSLVLEKLGLHSVSAITTSVDVSLTDKKTLSYKAWEDFKKENFNAINSATKSIFIQWDFFATFSGYKVPQRHTLNVRITSSLQPSDMLNAIQAGVLTNSTKSRLEKLEAQQKELEVRIAEEKITRPRLSENQVRFWLTRFRKLDPNMKSHRETLINTFVNAVYLYDEKVLITFNYKDGTKTITFDEIAAKDAPEGNGSDLGCFAPPKNPA